MITIKEALSKKDMKDYVMFSFELYKNNPYWIPPIIAEELETFDKTKNPALQTAEAHFYLAYKEGSIVGKIAAIINWEEVTIFNKIKSLVSLVFLSDIIKLFDVCSLETILIR